MSEVQNILIIDDSDDDRLFYTRALSKSGHSYAFQEAADGDAGLHMIEKTMPSCILLDYSLPGHNGIDVLKNIRAKYQFLPVVMLTGQGNESVAVLAMQQGAQNYITKSDITSDSLSHAIQMAIEYCGMQQHIEDQRLSLEVFTRALAHDLKEPVRTIISFMELITDRTKLSEKSQDYFQYIVSAAERMGRLIDTIHLYTRLDAAEKMNVETCNTQWLLEETIENLSKLITERGAEVKVNQLPKINGNHVQLTQLFQNLISNAIKHNRKPVKIAVGCTDRVDHWMFYINDDGEGIEETDLIKIFDPFNRVSHNDNSGLGMGLAISKKIVESLGGRIWCESNMGEGTTFFIAIPKNSGQTLSRYPDEFSADVEMSNNINAEIKKEANILLVDDNKMDIELTKIILFEQPKVKCRLNVATDGHEAMDTMQSSLGNKNPIDLILLDINMPRMNGFELLEQIRRDDLLKGVPVIICTTSAYDKDEQQAKKLGVSGYMVKPMRFDKLKEIIETVPNLYFSEQEDRLELRRA